MSNTLRNLMSRGGLSFAHLGRSRASDDDSKDDRDDDSGKGKRSKRASDDDNDDDGQNRENGDSKRSKRASDDDKDDERAEDDDLDDDDKDDGKGKRSKRASDDDTDDERAEDDDDDEEEMRGKSASARARRRERARCAAIFASKGAGRNPVLACKLAFTTTMTRSEAISVLDGSPAPEGSRGQRQNPRLAIDGIGHANREQAIEASWDVAFKKAGAKERRAR